MEAGDPTDVADGSRAITPLDVSALPHSRTSSQASSSYSSSRVHQQTRPRTSSTLFRVELSPASRVGYIQGLPRELAKSETEINLEGGSPRRRVVGGRAHFNPCCG